MTLKPCPNCGKKVVGVLRQGMTADDRTEISPPSRPTAGTAAGD